ncbi:uncharacterized protein B0I36DRAFT_405457 [Microdochium trichocladiopsis]|uniref:Uncharacterized protein n=1 Tax=Microdochium trichocladiopsis TaxID=1682393 RepID=A0A9P8YDJ6_9PEZI|nr:uncharacterized protein B0I36DRAFT_405457 [Microdochium trichocladiopsis]KAH7034917.1 hypothetical protein B0I36DRAFT_405457 [Microdochium trichocladiopsis]
MYKALQRSVERHLVRGCVATHKCGRIAWAAARSRNLGGSHGARAARQSGASGQRQAYTPAQNPLASSLKWTIEHYDVDGALCQEAHDSRMAIGNPALPQFWEVTLRVLHNTVAVLPGWLETQPLAAEYSWRSRRTGSHAAIPRATRAALSWQPLTPQGSARIELAGAAASLLGSSTWDADLCAAMGPIIAIGDRTNNAYRASLSIAHGNTAFLGSGLQYGVMGMT